MNTRPNSQTMKGEAASSRNVRFRIALILLALVAMATPTAATAESLVVLQDGRGVTALFSDHDGCVDTTTLVVASSNTERVASTSGVRSLQLAVVVSQVDVCAIVPILTGAGVTADASVHVAPDMRTATVTGTVPVLNQFNGSLVHVTVDLQFEAIAHPTASAGVELQVGESFRLITTDQQRHRDAVATGLISSDVGGVLHTAASIAMIRDVHSGTTIVVRD
jgi:hypothetical protein